MCVILTHAHNNETKLLILLSSICYCHRQLGIENQQNWFKQKKENPKKIFNENYFEYCCSGFVDSNCCFFFLIYMYVLDIIVKTFAIAVFLGLVGGVLRFSKEFLISH